MSELIDPLHARVTFDSRASIPAFCDALVRSEQTIQAALLAFEGGNDDLFETLMDRATAIGDEWNMHSDLRESLIEAARENILMGRSDQAA